MRRIRLFPPAHLLAAILAMVALHEIIPVLGLFSTPWRWLGLLPLVAGIVLNLWAHSLFKKHQTTIKPGQKSSQLVTEGPFRFSRNPIYLGMVLILAGIAIRLGSVSPWLIIPIFIMIIARTVIPLEESMLQETFGTEYQKYQTEVRRWI